MRLNSSLSLPKGDAVICISLFILPALYGYSYSSFIHYPRHIMCLFYNKKGNNIPYVQEKIKTDSCDCRYPHRLLFDDDPYTGQTKAEYCRSEK